MSKMTNEKMIASRFERMVAIPEQHYNYLKNLQQTNHPTQTLFSSLTNDYSRQGQIQDPYVRIQRQGETLDAMKKLKDDMRQRIIQSTPKPYQSRADNLLQYVEGHIPFNERGEMLDANELPIDGSNITDLIQHAVRDRRRNIQPKGWQFFKDRLQGLNVPHSLLNYDTLDEMKRSLRIKQSPDSFIKGPQLPFKRTKEESKPIVSPPKAPRKRRKTQRFMEDEKYF